MTTKVLLLVVAIALVTSSVRAEPPAGVLPMKMLGSDTLREVTRQVIDTCGLLDNLDYQGTGTTNGGNAMRARDQQVASQSRFLNSTECADFGTGPQLGQGITVGLDGLGVFGDASEVTACTTLRWSGSLLVNERNNVPGLQCPGCSADHNYAFTDWRDALRIIYAGQSAHINQDPCTDLDPTRSPSTLGGTAPANCGNAAVGAGEQCDDGNTNNFDGCASNCTLEIAHAERCNSDLRRELIGAWGNMFQNLCSDPECSELRHAFRRDDASGTTDVFLTLLALPAATTRTFCNGFDVEDLDPIRRACDPNEQVCASTSYANRNANPNGGPPTAAATGPASGQPGDLGLVLPVHMPADLDKQYAGYCGAALGGAFKYAPMPFAVVTEAQRCPDGTKRKLNQCRWPVDSSGQFNCLAQRNNRPGAATIAAGFAAFDARGYNLIPRDPATGAILLPNPNGINDARWGGGGWYRIHQIAALAIGSGRCEMPDATQQLGCLVNPSPCSMSFAGREAVFAGTNKAFKLRSPLSNPGGGFPAQEIAPEDVLIRRLLDPAGPAAGTCGNGLGDNFGYRYPLARRLWFNAAKGFGLPGFTRILDSVDSNDADATPDLSSMERQLAICMADRTLTDQAIVDNGYITVTDTNCSTGFCDPADLAINFRARSCDPRCGDGILQLGEACDDGNTAGADGCNASCTGA